MDPIRHSWQEDQARQNRFETNMKQRIAPYNSREDSGIFGKYVALPFIITTIMFAKSACLLRADH
jgi:hypothetical protein